ncbi:MAG: PTS sugar transporter subunit IIA, partial [Deltaproteobacteria bacterium]|nr:PTS sugar transporter subunit IIA [Deltaproteobacteria bacterium]
LAVFYDAGVRYLREILVHVEPNKHDMLVISTAKHLAEVDEAELTLVGFVPEKAPLPYGQREADYVDQLRALCPATTKTLIVSGRTKAEAIGHAAAGYDLLVTAEDAHGNLWRRIRGTSSDRITETVTVCSVLRLQSPMDRTHETFDWAKAREELQAVQLSSYVDRACVMVGLHICSKAELFDIIAETFGAVAEHLCSEEILTALWEREGVRGTAAGMGLAMPHATVPSARRTRIGIFTIENPIDYEAPDSRGVDVLFVTIGGADARRSHLVVMSAISKVVLESTLLNELRVAKTRDDALRALDVACGVRDGT